MLFDSHAHYYDDWFGDDTERARVIENVKNSGVKYVLNAGTDPITSAVCLELAEKNDGFFASCGIHPESVDSIDDIDAALIKIKELCRHPKAVAIGEIGLDYHYTTENKDKQMKLFLAQLELAREISLPVIVHDREAHGDCLDAVLKFPEVKGVFHSFSGSRETAAELLKRGWYISFSGVVTFKNATRLAEIVPTVPDDRLLIETDCPYLAPHPMRGKRNDSSLMRYTAEKIAELKGTSYGHICEITAKNASALFSKTNIIL